MTVLCGCPARRGVDPVEVDHASPAEKGGKPVPITDDVLVVVVVVGHIEEVEVESVIIVLEAVDVTGENPGGGALGFRTDKVCRDSSLEEDVAEEVAAVTVATPASVAVGVISATASCVWPGRAGQA